MTSLYQVAQAGTANATDVNQIVQALTGQLLANPGPVVQIATQTINAATSGVTFSNIPAYNNIMLSWQARSTNATNSAMLFMGINSDFSANYYDCRVFGFNSAAGSDRTAAATTARVGELAAASAGAGNTGSGLLVIPGWNSTTAFAQGISMAGWGANATATGIACEVFSQTYAVTGTYTSITLVTSGNFAGNVVPCRFTLYGSM